MKAKIVIVTMGVGLIAVGALVGAQDSEPQHAGLFPYADVEAVVRGGVLYADYCAACHGQALEGQGDWRAPNATGRMPAPPHDETGHTWHHPDVQLFRIVKYGTAALVGNGYESDMAGYAEVLTDQEIFEVMAYIKSTWPDDVIQRHNAMNDAVANQ